MKSQNVKINIQAEQELQADDTCVEQCLPGLRTDDEKGKIFLRYEEKMEGVDEKVRTLITLQGGMLHMKRSGGIKTTMDFMVGKTTTCEYFTPMGVMHFSITTDDLVIRVNREEIDVDLKYVMSMDGDVVSVNHFHMNVLEDDSFSDVELRLS